MKDFFNKIFTLGGLKFLAVLFVALVAILIFAPLESTLFGGIVLFSFMLVIKMWAINKYNDTPNTYFLGMNIEEQNYADYLFNLADPFFVADSWDNIITSEPIDQQEIDFLDYRLTVVDREESDYAIFSNLFDRINNSIHSLYEAEFDAIGYTLHSKCQRKKAPTPH
jgi:hypothetical protein